MDEFELERFTSSDSCVKNSKEDKRKSRTKIGAYTLMAMGTFAILAFIGFVFIFKTDSKSSSFDELVTTGGAVRRSIQDTAKNVNFNMCKTTECTDVKKYILDSMTDRSDLHQPCDNFYKFACGGWISKNPIPKTSSTFSTFSKLNQNVEKILRRILESTDPSTEKGMLKNVKKFYRSCMDEKGIDKKGKKPMMDLVNSIGSWDLAGNDKSWDKKNWDFVKTLLQIQKSFTSSGGPLISVHVSDDPRHSTKHILEVDQAGPSLPREIYCQENEERSQTLTAYKEYLVEVAYELCRDDENNDQCTLPIIKKKANETIEFERKLAKISVPDDVKQESWFHRMTLNKLQEEMPDFPLKEHVGLIFEGRRTFTGDEEIIVPAIEYLKKVMDIVKNEKKETLSNYVVWSVIQDEVPYLSCPFRKIRMRYKQKVLGSQGLRARWKTCVSYSNEYLGEILGKLYIEKNFKKSTKTITADMIKNIRRAFQDNVKTLTWMDEPTKLKVQEKAAAMKDQVGYPSYIGNETRFHEKYKKLLIHDDDFFQNRINMIAFAHNRMLKKINEKVDKTEWPMDPQTINAMYSFNENGMIIPAGILEPPFYHGENAPMAMTYGAIGSILGHELTHGFDNTGRKFNKMGELRQQWWSNKSLEQFKERAQCMIDQYGKYKVRGKYPLNGKLTLGENIADNGGLKTALRAYNDYLARSNNDNVIAGLPFTNKQLFYIGFAQAYCSHSRKNEQYLATLNDRHSEEEFRVIGTLSNCKEFSKVFNCPIGSRMNPVKKCSVWVNEKSD